MRPTRRTLLATFAALPPAFVLARRAGAAQDEPSLEPTPACGDDEPTPATTAGPYYRPSSPLRTDLRSEVDAGAPIALAGLVLDTRCRPIASARVEIWHANDAGTYDMRGFRLRAQQVTDAAGRWAFDTIVTPPYSNRTAHYHFRVSRPGARALVTQVFFPDQPRNARDRLFDARLVMRMSRHADGAVGRFDFVLA